MAVDKIDNVQELKNKDKEIELLQKQLLELQKKQTETKSKIPDELEIEITVGVNSPVYFFDEKGRINFTTDLDGMFETDVIEYKELRKMVSNKKDFLSKGIFIITDILDGDYKKADVIKSLRLKEFYEGDVSFANIDAFILKTPARKFADTISNLYEENSFVLPVLIEKFSYYYREGKIKDIDKIKAIKFIVGNNNSLFS